MMYQLYAEGMTVSDICRTFLEKGYKSFRGSMSNKLITKALDSDLYIGKRTVKAQFSASGEDEVVENDHAAVISLELNEKVKARRIIELKKQERRLATNKAKKEALNGTNGNGAAADDQ